MMNDTKISRRALLPVMTLAACAPLTANAQQHRETETQSVHVRSAGDGARTWVLVHPFSGSGRFWSARAATLAAQGLRVLAPDLPSHGQSRIVHRFSYDAATDAVAEAIASQRESTELIIGASSGSVVAMKLAARWQKPVVAIGGWLAFSATNTERMREQSRELPPITAQFVDAFLEQGTRQRAAFQRHFADLADLGQSPLLSETEISAIAGHTLLINGAADNFFSRESAHALADAIPGSLLTFVGGADHLEPLAAAHSRFTWTQIGAFVQAGAA